MTRKKLNDKLKELGLEHQYSLDGSLEPNQYILYHNYLLWEFFLTKKGDVGISKFSPQKRKLMTIFIKML